MKFKKNIPINITGPTYLDNSRPLSSQESKNLYQDVVDAGKDNYVLRGWYGLTLKESVGNIDRGMIQQAEIGYRVSGQKLYSFNRSGIHAELADIPGTDRCILSNDGTNIIIVSNTGVYKWNGAISTVTDSNIVGSEAVTFLNSQMIYTKNKLFTIADPNLPDTASGLNSAAAESKPDDLVICYAFQQSAYMFGKRSTEPWWNSGEGNPPIARIDGQIFEVGCASKYSVANTDEFIYWLGDDNFIYRATGGTKEAISSSAISFAIENYEVKSDAIGQTLTINGLNFYIITFPSANKTWVLNEQLGKNGWFNISSGLNDGKYQATSFLSVYGKVFAADATNGGLYELSSSDLTNSGESIQRRRVTSSINSGLFGEKGSELQMSKMKIIMQTGNTIIDGQGADPQIQFEVSYDGGNSWVNKGWGHTGRLGEFTIQVEMFNLDVFYDCIVRLTTTDPSTYTLYSASADLRLTGSQ